MTETQLVGTPIINSVTPTIRDNPVGAIPYGWPAKGLNLCHHFFPGGEQTIHILWLAVVAHQTNAPNLAA